MYNPSLGRWNGTDPYYQHDSPYLAMANNPVSFVDPDGGRAVMTEYMKKKILNHLFDTKSNITRIEWLTIWMGATGMNHYRGLTFEGFYAAIATGTARGINAAVTLNREALNTSEGIGLVQGDISAAIDHYLGPLGGGFLDGGISNGTNPIPEADKSSSGIFIDGLEVSSFAYNAFVDNTLREDIIQVASNNVSFGYSAGKYYDNSQGAFGSGKTNREVREEQNRENRVYNEALKKLYQQNKAITQDDITPGSIKTNKFSVTNKSFFRFSNLSHADKVEILDKHGRVIYNVISSKLGNNETFDDPDITGNYFTFNATVTLKDVFKIVGQKYDVISIRVTGHPKLETRWSYQFFNAKEIFPSRLKFY